MSWISKFLESSVGKKLLMSLSGLFLCLFLVIHMLGNFQLLLSDGGKAFNIYAKTMTSNPLIQVVSIFTYYFILLHAIQGIYLTVQNRKARPVKYAMSKETGASWTSKNMALLGVIILFFLVVHLKSFWFEYKVGDIPMVSYDGVEYKDLYTIVAAAFSQWWYVLIYLVSLVALGLHLQHGFQSAFQTLGLNHKKYTPIINAVGLGYSILIPLGFAIQPLYMLFNQ